MSRRSRWWAGLIATPLVVFALQLFLTPVLFYLHLVRPWIGPYPDTIQFGLNARMLLSLLGIAFIDVLLPGLPALLVLLWLRKTSVWAYVVAGLSAALLASALALELFALGDSGHWFTLTDPWRSFGTRGELVRAVQMFFVAPAVYGAITALVFWLLVRPDRSAAAA